MNYHDDNISGLIEETIKYINKLITFHGYSDDRIFDRYVATMVQNCYYFKNALKDQYLINKDGKI